MSSRLRALSVLIAVFLTGMVIGSGSLHLWLKSHPAYRPIPDRMFAYSHHRLPELLQLSPEQERRFREIMGESRQKFDAAWTECAPKFGTIRAEMHAKILAILDNEQKKRFETFLKEMVPQRGRTLSCPDSSITQSGENWGQSPYFPESSAHLRGMSGK